MAKKYKPPEVTMSKPKPIHPLLTSQYLYKERYAEEMVYISARKWEFFGEVMYSSMHFYSSREAAQKDVDDANSRKEVKIFVVLEQSVKRRF
jgi:hypothetical protein